VTSTSITIGGIASLTNASGAVFPGADIGAKALFEHVNRDGGINGRKINYVGVLDDATDPTKNMTAVKQLVLQKKVFAIAPIMSIALQPQASDYLAAQKVPFVGWGVQPGFCGNNYGFGFNGCLIGTKFNNTSVLGPTAALLKPGATVAIVEGDSSAGKAALRQLPAVAADLGLKIVYLKAEIPDATTTTDWTPYARKLMTSNAGGPPDAIHADGLLPQAAGLSAALKQLGFKGPIINYSTYAPGLLSSSPDIAKAVDGVYTNIGFGPKEQGGPAITQMVSDLKAIGAPTDITLGVANAYWSADMLVQMIKKAGPNLTPGKLDQAVNAGFTYTPSVAGAMGPTTFPAGHDQPSPCAALVQAKGTSYVAAVPFKCYKAIPAS
jgi:ABC-type branched-subunit amino acid transport system substrate-binding protein